MFEFIEKVVYINLADRTDRREEIEAELAVFPKEKIVRFEGIKEKNGNHGCSKSHIGVIELALENNWSNVLVIEDDAKWNDFDTGYAILEKLMKEPYDVISLGALGGYWNKDTYRACDFQTTTAYVVSNRYYHKLLENYKAGLELLLSEKTYHGKGCIDQHWKLLQENDLWFRIYPHFVYQRPSYSDIIKKHVDYSGPRHFDIKPKE